MGEVLEFTTMNLLPLDLLEHFPLSLWTGEGKFELIKAHYSSSGLISRVHGNTGYTPAHALVIIRCVTQPNAILLPGCIPGYKRSDIQILRAIWLLYEERSVAYSTFCHGFLTCRLCTPND